MHKWYVDNDSSRYPLKMLSDESAASLSCSVVSSIWCLVAFAIHVPVLAGRAVLLPAKILLPVELIVNFLVWVWIIVVTAMLTKDFSVDSETCSKHPIYCLSVFGWLMIVFIALLMMVLLFPTKDETEGSNRAAHDTAA